MCDHGVIDYDTVTTFLSLLVNSLNSPFELKRDMLNALDVIAISIYIKYNVHSEVTQLNWLI